jgi:hypothetical protein
MPANLARTDSKPAIMYAGEVPWHRLGTRLDSPATAREVIVVSGLDYRVSIQPWSPSMARTYRSGRLSYVATLATC